jgi:hypothetical protein
MMLLIMQYSWASHHFIIPRSKYSPKHRTQTPHVSEIKFAY